MSVVIARLVLCAALVLGALFSTVAAAATTAQDDADELTIPEGAIQVTFLDNIDGDTFDVEVDDGSGDGREERVRMIGIDAPENSYSYDNEPECYGEQATKKAESMLVAADEIWLESDVRDRDDFDRLLRYVWIVIGPDQHVEFLNLTLVAEGYALANTYRPNTARQRELDAAERSAINEARGMWLSCDASVSMDADEEDESGPDDEPLPPDEDREVEEDAACAFFDNFEEAQEFLTVFPELAEDIDVDGDGTACEDWF